MQRRDSKNLKLRLSMRLLYFSRPPVLLLKNARTLLNSTYGQLSGTENDPYPNERHTDLFSDSHSAVCQAVWLAVFLWQNFYIGQGFLVLQL